MELGRAPSHILLSILEEWKNINSTPTGNTPIVVVLSRAAMMKAYIRARRSSEYLIQDGSHQLMTKTLDITKGRHAYLSALQEDVATVACFLSARLVLPIIDAAEKSKDSSWNTDKQVVKVTATGLEY
jgi:hypothetical protein